MSGLPYFIPDDEESLNLALILLIIRDLGATSRGKLLLNNERLRACLFLIKNPIIMNRVLASFSHPVANLEIYDEYSIAGIAINIDTLYDDHRLKRYLLQLASLDLLKVIYKKATGFMYTLTLEGERVERLIAGDYFNTARGYAKAIQALNSVSTANINAAVEFE
ncbi:MULTISPECIES: ABC-three component system middle component 4 [Comamonas]|uniref:ABC-three component system middle component 4 n=1 Tax=Comamonas TaxID=283 RepID=UPI0012D14BB1|nr:MULTISPECIES: ABC-three component system middle component 4 [Comamonas]MPS93180.1 hypothetical protein [Comamonas sp.]BDB70591.1 hypothetical protein Cthiooxydans_30030 [Comamonas thiooxydans]